MQQIWRAEVTVDADLAAELVEAQFPDLSPVSARLLASGWDNTAHVINESFEIVLRNHKKEAAHVLVKENLLRWTNWEITKSSDKWEKQDYRTIHIPVDVPADGEKKVTYSVKYTW